MHVAGYRLSRENYSSRNACICVYMQLVYLFIFLICVSDVPWPAFVDLYKISDLLQSLALSSLCFGDGGRQLRFKLMKDGASPET